MSAVTRAATAGPPEADRTSYCEQCGASGRLVARRAADRPTGEALLACRGCGLLSCRACWPGPFLACRACCLRRDPALVALIGEPPAPRAVPARARRSLRRRVDRPSRALIAAALFVALAFAASAMVVAGPVLPAGGVAGLLGRPTPSPSASTAQPTPSGEPATLVLPSATIRSADAAAAAPAGPADLAVRTAVVRPWTDDSGEVRAQVLASVVNRGGAPGRLAPAATTWRVVSPGEVTMAEGRFGWAFPPVVEPGATAWLIDTLSATFTDAADLGSVEVGVAGEPLGAAATSDSSLQVVGLDWRVDAAGHLSASGTVRNQGTDRVDRWAVGVILLAGDGQPIAGVYHVGRADQPLGPGSAAAFDTAYPGAPPVVPTEVQTVVSEAVALD